MRNARYRYYVIKFINLPFRKCHEYVCIPNHWIAIGIKKGIFVRFPSKAKEIKSTKKLLKKRRKYVKNWKHYKSLLIFGANTYDEGKKCIKERKFNICQDFWLKKTKFSLTKWKKSSSSREPTCEMNTAQKPEMNKPQMKVAPTRDYQNCAIKVQIPLRRFPWPNAGLHKKEVGTKLTASQVKYADGETFSSELVENRSENQLLPVPQNESNKSVVRMSTMISGIIDKTCSKNEILNDSLSQSQAINSDSAFENPTNEPNILDHGNCLNQQSHCEIFTEAKASYEKVCPISNIHSNLIPPVVSNSLTSTNQSYPSYRHYNANQPLPHADYLHSYPRTHGILTGMAAVVNNIDQRRLPQRHVTSSTSYPCRESEHTSSFWDKELMHRNIRTHSLTKRQMEINGYKDINPQTATSFSGVTGSFYNPEQVRSSQPLEHRSSLGLQDYLLLDHKLQKQVYKITTTENPISRSIKDIKSSAPQNPSNLENHYNRPSFQQHFSAIHPNFIFEDLSTQKQNLQNTKTESSNNEIDYLPSRQHDYTTLTNENYSRLYVPQPLPIVAGYSNRGSYTHDMFKRNPNNLSNDRISQSLSQGMPIPQSSTSVIPERNPIYTWPSFQDYSNVGFHHSYSNELLKTKQMPPGNNYNIQQNLRQQTHFENSTNINNVKNFTQGNIANEAVKEMSSSTNNSWQQQTRLGNFADTFNVKGYTQENITNKDVTTIPKSTKNACGSKISHHQPIPEYRPQPSASIISERNPIYTLPRFQDNSNAGFHHSHLNEFSNARQMTSGIRDYNTQDNLRQQTLFVNPTAEINEKYYTQGKVTSKDVKEILSLSNNSCCSKIKLDQLSQGMPISEYGPQPSTSIMPDRNPIHTLPSFQYYSNAGFHHSSSNELLKAKQNPLGVCNYNTGENLRQQTHFQSSSDTVNVKGVTQEKTQNKDVKEILGSDNNSRCSCECSQLYKDRAESNEKESYEQSHSNTKYRENIQHSTQQTLKEVQPLPAHVSLVANQTNIEKQQAVFAGEPGNHSERNCKRRPTIIRKTSLSKNVSHDFKQTTLTKYLDSFLKIMHEYSLRMLAMSHEEQRTLGEQKKILEDLMKLTTSKKRI